MDSDNIDVVLNQHNKFALDKVVTVLMLVIICGQVKCPQQSYQSTIN